MIPPGSAARTLVVAALLGVLPACGGSAAPPPSSAPGAAAPAPALHEGPLTDYVPAAGLRWLIVGEPQKLATNAGLMRAVNVVVPDARLALFAQSTGVDLRQTPEALAAGFDYGTLYMAATPRENVAVEEQFASRIISGAVRRSPDPRVHRIAGVIGQTPESLVHIDGLLVAVCTGDPTPVRVVEAFARKKLKRSRPALAGAALSTLPGEMASAPLRVYAPGPFQHDWLDGAHGLLASSLAAGITAKPLGDGDIELTVYLSGDWAQVGAAATDRLRQTWDDLAHGATGHLAGLDAPVRPPEVSATSNMLTLRVVVAALPLATGLHAAVAADVEEMLAPGGAQPAPANH